MATKLNVGWHGRLDLALQGSLHGGRRSDLGPCLHRNSGAVGLNLWLHRGLGSGCGTGVGLSLNLVLGH